jgi:hypothetical protein
MKKPPVDEEAVAALLEHAVREALRDLAKADLPLAPRHFVDLQTMSSWALGRWFKRELAHRLYDLRRAKESTGDAEVQRKKRVQRIRHYRGRLPVDFKIDRGE